MSKINMNEKNKGMKIAYTLLLALMLIEVSVFSFAIYQPFKRVSAGGTIQGEGVDLFYDSACTDNVTLLDWGDVIPGTETVWVLYLKNVGNVNGTFYVYTGNWSSPIADQYLTFSWNYTAGMIVEPDIAIPVEFVLACDPDVDNFKDFSFDILIVVEDAEYT